MEVQSDLGDSMVQVSSARYESAKTEFDFINAALIAWVGYCNVEMIATFK